MRSAIVIFAVTASVLAGSALGDTRTTTSSVVVRKRPGEKSPAIATLPAGTEVEIVREEGRWVWIRSKKVEGYVTRTTISEPATTASSPVVWSAPRQANGAAVTDLFVIVTAPTAPLRSAPGDSASAISEVVRGGRLAVLDAASHPAWIRARDDQGHDGWIARAAVGNGAASESTTGVDLATSQPVDAMTRRAPGRVAVRVDLGIGLRSLGMDLTSNAEGGLTNYLVDADAVALTLDTAAVVRMSGPWFVAVDARVGGSDASPGIEYLGPSSPSGEIPFRTFAVDAAVRGGLRVKRVLDVSVRAGGHYDVFLTRKVDNAGMLPRERLLGLTAGVVGEIVPPHSPFSAAVRVDALVIGSRAQTPGLEDGTSNTAHAVWGALSVRYLFGSRWALFGSYEFGRASTSWSGMSVRHPGVTSTQRVDTTQLLSAGISAEL